MDQQQSKEQELFENMLRKRMAAKARLHRKNVLQSKKSKRVKTDNSVMLNHNTPLNLPIDRTPLSEISPNIISQGSQSVCQNHNKGSTSFVIHSQSNNRFNTEASKDQNLGAKHPQSNYGFSTEASTSQNLGAKNRQFNHIGNLGINLCRRFDRTSSDKAPCSSNTFQPTTSHENPLLDDDSGDDYIYDDFEGMNFTLIITIY